MTKHGLGMEARFRAKVLQASEDECWWWIGTVSRRRRGLRDSYGQIGPDGGGGPVYAHRYAYELMVGPIPAGMTIDHLCQNTLCMNPKHMEVTTVVENLRRGNGMGARNAIKTHCPRGHEYSPDNTRVYRNMRYCKACRRVG